MSESLIYTDEEYQEWKRKFEAGYATPRAGVGAEQVQQELDSVPRAIQYTYLYRKHVRRSEEQA